MTSTSPLSYLQSNRILERTVTMRDFIGDYLSNYCHSEQVGTTQRASMWSEMNEISDYYQESLDNGKNAYTYREIIRMCVRGLYTTGHQKRVPEDAINESVDKLLTGTFSYAGQKYIFFNQKTGKFYKHFFDFEELYEAIRQIIGGVSGIGWVTLYDTARRIGFILARPITPIAYVYVHYNCVNRSAQSILNRRLPYRIPALDFLPDFGTFPSIAIEDMLCIYSDFFTEIPQNEVDDELVKHSRKIFWRKMTINELLQKLLAKKRKADKSGSKRWKEFTRH